MVKCVEGTLDTGDKEMKCSAKRYDKMTKIARVICDELGEGRA